MMNTLLSVVLRIVLTVAGLLFVAGVVALALVLMGLWLLRAAWAKLTGRPISPWLFAMNRQTLWSHFSRASGGNAPWRSGARRDPNVVDIDPGDVRSIPD